MLKEVGTSGQISLGKKYAGQLFDLQTTEDGSLKLTPVKVVPINHIANQTTIHTANHAVNEAQATYAVTPRPAQGDGWVTPERLARRTATAARTPTEMDAASTQWENDNKASLEAMKQRMTTVGSLARRIHESRKRTAPLALQAARA